MMNELHSGQITYCNLATAHTSLSAKKQWRGIYRYTVFKIT
jgi:hypothetical protein